jgi:hypothetical protein
MLNLLQKIIFSVALFLFLPIISHASTLYIDSPNAVYGPGDSFLVDLKLDIGEEACINTIETGLEFPKNYLQVLEFISGESFINIWLKNPGRDEIIKANTEGILNFSGGIPGGYCGKIPGDPGDSNIVGRVAFSIPGTIISDEDREELSIIISRESRLLLNDGLGTDDKIEFKDLTIDFRKKKTGLGGDWESSILNDDISPEPFIVELYSNPNIYQGQYYIIFSSTDKQSGIDHYEVLEIRLGDRIGEKPKVSFKDKLFGIGRDAPLWEKAEIPYLLFDQSLQSLIKVRAIDRNGNERLVEFIPPENIRQLVQKNIKSNVLKNSFIIVIIILLFILFIILTIIYIKKRKKYDYNKEGQEEN